MVLDDVVTAQKRGEATGIASICSAHPFVLRQTLNISETYHVPALIEATCNQVNQFGGYTGMRPPDFFRYVRGIAREINFPFEHVILGGDHLGPSVWQAEPAEVAMEKAATLVRAYVEAGFSKIHLDCSMRLGDDPEGALDIETAAERAVRLAGIAEKYGEGKLRYVIGTEVPVPGGATEHEDSVAVTRVDDVRQTIQITRAAFIRAGIQPAWERVTAVVVQPGVEFGDEFVLPYQPKAAQDLARFIQRQPLVFEAHSTDYQAREALRALVRDGFAILKVGPSLTYAFRAGVFALAMIENETVPVSRRSNLIQVLDDAMLRQPEFWKKYYSGSETEQAYKRKYSLSDRIRYYWTDAAVKQAFETMMGNLRPKPLPVGLARQYFPDITMSLEENGGRLYPQQALQARIHSALEGYALACHPLM